MSNHTALIIFIKNPKKGHVKTRLAKTVGDDEALRIYKELMRHTREVAESVDVDRWLFYSQNINHEDNWSPELFNKQLQATGDLGDRMTLAFNTALEHSSKAIIIGSDCPRLSDTAIQQAIAALDTHDFTIGPTYDGGYYLLGMKSFAPTLVNDIKWSSGEEYGQTLTRIAQLDASVKVLPTQSDVDYEEDWVKWGW